MIALFAIPLWVCGQVEYAEEKTKINAIKKDAKYIYGEGIAETEADALSAAEQILRSEVMRVISEKESLQDAESVIINAIKGQSSQIKLKRGTMARVFLYVKKENISPGHQTMEVSLWNEPRATEEEVTEEEVTEVADEITEVEPEVPDMRKTEDIREPDPKPKPAAAPPIISDILAASGVTDLQTYLQGQKDAYKIMYGKVGTEINPAWYIIAISGNEIKAVFDKGLNTRKNFLTGKQEDMSNYGNCTKIWLKIINE
jgi:hypothetical protein